MNLHPDAFSSGQILSKIWLAENLERIIECNFIDKSRKILCLGGWYGLMNFVIRARNNIKVETFRSLDLDPDVEEIADKVNNSWEWQNWQFKSIIGDANSFEYTIKDFDTVINTSTEHIPSTEWFKKIPSGCLVALQSNDMFHEDHCHNHQSLNDLIDEFPLTKTFFSGEKDFVYPSWQFRRFMIIGIK
jgi:hypothetical protein